MFDFISVAASNQWYPLIRCCYSVADSCLTLHDPMHRSTATFPCPSLSPGVCWNSRPLHWWCCLITSQFPRGVFPGLPTFWIHVMTPIESDDISTSAWDKKKRLFEPEVMDLEIPFLFSHQVMNLMSWPTTLHAFVAHLCRSLPREVTKTLIHVFFVFFFFFFNNLSSLRFWAQVCTNIVIASDFHLCNLGKLTSECFHCPDNLLRTNEVSSSLGVMWPSWAGQLYLSPLLYLLHFSYFLFLYYEFLGASNCISLFPQYLTVHNTW